MSLEIARNIHREELNTLRNVEKKKDKEKIDVFFLFSFWMNGGSVHQEWLGIGTRPGVPSQETEALQRDAESQEGTKRRIGTEGVRAGGGETLVDIVNECDGVRRLVERERKKERREIV